MIKEAMEYWVQLARMASSPDLVPETLDLTEKGGQVFTLERRMPTPSLFGVRDVVEYLESLPALPHGAGYQVLVGPTGITIVNGFTRLPCAHCKLKKSRAFTRLRPLLDRTEGVSHADFAYTFRHLLSEETPAGWLQQFASLDFRRMASATSTHDRDADTLGRSVEERVNSVEALPDSVALRMPLFVNEGFDEPLDVLIRVIVRPSTPALPFVLLWENEDAILSYLIHSSKQGIVDVIGEGEGAFCVLATTE